MDNKSKNFRLLDNDKLKNNALLRAKILRLTRTFFQDRGFLEVDTPLVDVCPSMEPAIKAFETDYFDAGARHTMYLQSSPEYNMKKLLVGGYGNIYQITKSFRNSELTRLHNPEFTILEWYRTGSDYHRIMDDVQDLMTFLVKGIKSGSTINYLNKKVDLSPPYDRLTIKDAFRIYSNIDLESLTDTEYYDILRGKGLEIKRNDADFSVFFYYIFVNEIEPNLGNDKPVFLMDFPVRLGSLARKKSDEPECVERFELYIRGLELCNAFSELNDHDEQLSRFLTEKRQRADRGLGDYPIDEDFLGFLKTGMPDAAGVAFGIDRLLMLFADTDDINDVILFPFSAMKDFKENV